MWRLSAMQVLYAKIKTHVSQLLVVIFKKFKNWLVQLKLEFARNSLGNLYRALESLKFSEHRSLFISYFEAHNNLQTSARTGYPGLWQVLSVTKDCFEGIWKLKRLKLIFLAFLDIILGIISFKFDFWQI